MPAYQTTYQVVRPFPGHKKIGEMLTASDFASPHRAAQLLDQRRIAPVTVKSEYQPSVQQLLGTTIRSLREIIDDVADACVLQEAMTLEEREVARTIYEKRLRELEGQDAQPTN